MELNKSNMLEIVRKQLSIDINCNIQDFLKDGIVFCEAKLNDGRKMFDRQSPFLEIATMGKSTIVSADSDVLTKVKPLLETKTREDIYDVLPQFRNKGLASSLVSNLAIMIMKRGIVTYYGTASSNIPSQSVAYKSGFTPTWMCSYKNTFDGTAPYEQDIKINF